MRMQSIMTIDIHTYHHPYRTLCTSHSPFSSSLSSPSLLSPPFMNMIIDTYRNAHYIPISFITLYTSFWSPIAHISQKEEASLSFKTAIILNLLLLSVGVLSFFSNVRYFEQCPSPTWLPLSLCNWLVCPSLGFLLFPHLCGNRQKVHGNRTGHPI